MDRTFDYIVIGAGPAGYVSAVKAAQLGMSTAVIEKNELMLGGVCLNEGCIPAKSLFSSAKHLKVLSEEASLYGAENFKPDMTGFVGKSRKASDMLRKGVAFLFKKNGISLFTGNALFLDSSNIEVTGDDGKRTVLRGGKILIATGSIPQGLNILPFDGKYVLTSSDAIRSESVPRTMLVVGGGAIGSEFASYFNILGTEVSIAEKEEHILPLSDGETAKAFESILRKQGVKILTSSILRKAEIKDGEVEVEIDLSGKKELTRYEKVLVAVGRRPNTSGLGLDEAGVITDEKGFIKIDAGMRTNIGNIFAAGDAVNTPMLAHVASAEGEIAALTAAGKEPAGIDYYSVPNVVYADIETAGIGLTEEEAAVSGKEIAIGRQMFRANGKAVLSLQPDGFIKIIADRHTRKFMGVHILGSGAGELIHEFAVAKRAGLSVDDVERTVHAHPTLSEAAVDACKAVFGKPIHG
ncbi:MAG: dihydrolipoyl dehydrogenase [Candidatus Omnitrophota bacterium]|nr:dihydrolipoyl dehydrogenase [Candidatus Omnitrophota bacterium]